MVMMSNRLVVLLGAICVQPLLAIGAVGQMGTQPSVGAQSTGIQALTPSSQMAGNLNSSSDLISSVPEDFSRLRIGRGALLSLDVLDFPELSGTYRVEDNGEIRVPFLGSVVVQDRTAIELEKKFVDLLSDGKYVKQPQVVVRLLQFQPLKVSVSGEVVQPGQVTLLVPRSLSDVLSRVGGVTPLAGKIIEVTTMNNGQAQTNRYSFGSQQTQEELNHILLSGGETVNIPRAGVVYVLGAVNRPGGYLMQDDGGLNVAQALSLALGTTLQAKVGETRIIRRTPTGSLEMLPVDYRKVMSAKELPIDLKANDVVYVPVSKLKATFTTGQAVLSAAATSTVYATTR